MIPHFSLPFRFVTAPTGYTVAAVSDQDSEAEIDDCAETVIRFPQGYRIEKPDFGNPGQEFNPGGIDEAVVRNAIATWEPRAEALLSQSPNRYDPLITDVELNIQSGQISAIEAEGTA